MGKRKPPRKAHRRLIGPVELPMTDAELLRDARRLAARQRGLVGDPSGPVKGRSAAESENRSAAEARNDP